MEEMTSFAFIHSRTHASSQPQPPSGCFRADEVELAARRRATALARHETTRSRQVPALAPQ